MHVDSYLDHLRADATRIATTAEAGPLDAPVAACPGWDLRELLGHVGYIHRWARFAVLNARPPSPADIDAAIEQDPPPADDAEGTMVATWVRAGADRLAIALSATDPDATTWHPFPVERKAWVWRRRQAHETAMHRWDAEVAVSGTSSLDAQLAADGVLEYLQVGLPRVFQRESTGAAPRSSLHIHCVDVPGEWMVTSDEDGLRVTAGDGKGDAGIHGSAESILLLLMGRTDRSAIEIVGDYAVADAWLSVPGW